MKSVKSSLFAIPVIVVTMLIVGCSTGFAPPDKENTTPVLSSAPSSYGPTNGVVQSHTGGSVTIDVEWVKLENNSLTFSVAMNTHSVDLDSYDLGKLAVLRDDTNNEYYPVSWDSAPGGHHRQGTLVFSLPESVSQGTAEYVEVVIRDVAGIEERVLKWEL